MVGLVVPEQRGGEGLGCYHGTAGVCASPTFLGNVLLPCHVLTNNVCQRVPIMQNRAVITTTTTHKIIKIHAFTLLLPPKYHAINPEHET